MNPYMNQNGYPQGYQLYPGTSGQQPQFEAQQPQYDTQQLRYAAPLPQYGAQQPQYGAQPSFPQMPAGPDLDVPQNIPQGQQIPGMLPAEQSYIENILRLNKGKLATVFMTFENNTQWNALTVKGIIEAAGRDHLIISDPETGKRYLFPMVYLDYITFDEEIEYEYPFGSVPGMSSYPPRFR